MGCRHVGGSERVGQDLYADTMPGESDQELGAPGSRYKVRRHELHFRCWIAKNGLQALREEKLRLRSTESLRRIVAEHTSRRPLECHGSVKQIVRKCRTAHRVGVCQRDRISAAIQCRGCR